MYYYVQAQGAETCKIYHFHVKIACVRGDLTIGIYIKNCVTILTCLNFSHLQSSLHLVHLLRCFFHCSKQFLNLSILMTFSVSAVFLVSPHPHQQNVSLWGFSSSRETKICHSGQDRMSREDGAQQFLVKNCWTLSGVWGDALINHPSWNGQKCVESSKKHSLKPNAASHNNTSWYTDPDGFPEHSPSKGSLYHKGPALQKVFHFGGSVRPYAPPQWWFHIVT